MLKKFLIVLIAIVILFAFISIAVSAPPKGKITISVTGAKNAVFDHDAHVKSTANCQECHHKDAAGKEQKCSNCHTAEGKDGASPGKKAFHDKCGKCHAEKAKGPMYPKDCKTCHPA